MKNPLTFRETSRASLRGLDFYSLTSCRSENQTHCETYLNTDSQGFHSFVSDYAESGFFVPDAADDRSLRNGDYILPVWFEGKEALLFFSHYYEDGFASFRLAVKL